ncbi:MAG: HIT family protein [Nanoarchaeota archaeon]
MVEETLFEKIIKGEIPSYKIYEDEKHYAFLDISPFEKGHTLVVPKKPYKTIFDMPQSEYLELMKVVYKISLHYEKVLGCGINIWNNNKNIANQLIYHVHVHIIPRLENKAAYALENGTKYGNEKEAKNTALKLALKE